MNKRAVGEEKEGIAKQYLETKGLIVLKMNYRCRQGEIDIVARENECLIFAEVKYRSTTRCGRAAEAVTVQKQRKICRVSDVYRYQHRIPEEQTIRYDVVAIDGENIHWYQNAFDYQRGY